MTVLFLLGFTFLLVALSTGAALAYSGCTGSFSTNNLKQHQNNTESEKYTFYHVAHLALIKFSIFINALLT